MYIFARNDRKRQYSCAIVNFWLNRSVILFTPPLLLLSTRFYRKCVNSMSNRPHSWVYIGWRKLYMLYLHQTNYMSLSEKLYDAKYKKNCGEKNSSHICMKNISCFRIYSARIGPSNNHTIYKRFQPNSILLNMQK